MSDLTELERAQAAMLAAMRTDRKPAKITGGLLAGIGELVGRGLGIASQTRAELAELRARVAALESAPVEMAGVHERGATYRRGHLVIRDGSLWYCKALTTASTPGQSADWLLCVKRARLTEADR